MATHSSVVAWRTPWTEEPGRLQFMEVQRGRQDWVTNASSCHTMVFPVVMYGCESWAIKKAECQRTDAFKLWYWRRLLRVPWNDWSWTEALILWLLDVKSWLIGKDSDAGKDGGQEDKGVTEDEMYGWHHWLNGHDFEQTLGDGEGQRSLVCCSP